MIGNSSLESSVEEILRSCQYSAGLPSSVVQITPVTHWGPENLALAFITCPRKPAYFADTLASALSSDPRTAQLHEVVVAVDAPDLACVAALTGQQRIRWVARTREENERVEAFRVHRRACHNYWRALNLVQPGSRAVIVCEDDLTFRSGWLGMLLECLNEMQSRKLNEYLLAIYSAYDHEHRPLRRGRYYSSYVAHDFYGTQAMLYPTSELEPVKKLLWNHGVEAFEKPYDLLIKRRAIARQHLYSTRHSLVQHVGAQSTGLGDGRHRSPSFGRVWPADKLVNSGSNGEGKLRVLTSIAHDCQLLPHFVAYYRSLGVESFSITVHETRPGMLAEVQQIASKLGEGIELLPPSERQQRTGVSGSVEEELRQRVARAGDWIIPADLDEFIQFPLPLNELIKEINDKGADYLSGEFSDRVSSDGTLIPTTSEPNLWEQYPLECDFSARFVRCVCKKVVLCRGNCALSSGHHYVKGHAQSFPGRRAVVHHFKWRLGLLEALRRRVAVYRREGVQWVAESERILNYFEKHSRIVLEKFNSRAGWAPDVCSEAARSARVKLT